MNLCLNIMAFRNFFIPIRMLLDVDPDPANHPAHALAHPVPAICLTTRVNTLYPDNTFSDSNQYPAQPFCPGYFEQTPCYETLYPTPYNSPPYHSPNHSTCNYPYLSLFKAEKMSPIELSQNANIHHLQTNITSPTANSNIHHLPNTTNTTPLRCLVDGGHNIIHYPSFNSP